VETPTRELYLPPWLEDDREM